MPLDTVNDIRSMDAAGRSRSEIARMLHVSRNTVAKYADMEDMSPAAPMPRRRGRPALEGNEEWVAGVLEADLGAPRKQRHTARRIYDRLVAERGYGGSYSTVQRFVRELRLARAAAGGEGYLELEWAPGTCQVDFGNFRAAVGGRTLDLKLLVATLPHSNDRQCVALMSQRSECLCAGLLEIFRRWGRAPAAMVLDNATEAGRMVRGEVTESRLFSQFRAHYRFESRYCNPYSGNEKGSVENAVGFLRRNLWIGYTDVDSSGRGAGDGRAVYEGPQAPEAFHRRVQEADSRPLQRRQAQARDHGRVRPRQEHRGEVDQVDKRDRLAARRVQPHARAEPDPGARAREPQAPDGGRRLKTSGADIRSKVRAIAANEGRYPISAQCRLLGVARSTYYSMRSRADRPAAPDPAAPAVVAAHAASKGRYGSRKIKASLERSGVTVSRRRVCRIMRENGLVSAYGRKRFKVHPGAVNEADVPNVVARGFGGRAPRTHICSDLTYVRVGASWNYVCLLVDLYNREIVGHSAGPRKDARLVKSAFATLSFPISDIEVFHTDRGSEFDNAEIDLMLEAFGIERSLSAKGCPYDNAVDESTNRILKAELVHRETFGTTRELRAKLSDYVHWYNNFRIHSTLGYMSPVEFREAGLSLPESSK